MSNRRGAKASTISSRWTLPLLANTLMPRAGSKLSSSEPSKHGNVCGWSCFGDKLGEAVSLCSERLDVL